MHVQQHPGDINCCLSPVDIVYHIVELHNFASLTLLAKITVFMLQKSTHTLALAYDKTFKGRDRTERLVANVLHAASQEGVSLCQRGN